MLRAFLDQLRFLFGIGVPTPPDGFGQGRADDLRFARHFRRARRIEVAWRRPTAAEVLAIEADPIMGGFGDNTVAVANVGAEYWVVRDRMWFGWPDPPEFVFFAWRGTVIEAAKDFDRWPACWKRPGAV